MRSVGLWRSLFDIYECSCMNVKCGTTAVRLRMRAGIAYKEYMHTCMHACMHSYIL
jgi:hypothetical protein